MKFHSTISTIVISICVALMFALVGFFIITNLNMTSPTLIAANELLSMVENIDSNIEISFSSMDRNFREGVFINEFEVRYKNNELFKADKVSIKKSLFALIKYLVKRGDMLSISIDRAELYVPDIENTSSSSASSFDIDKAIDITLPDALSLWGIEFDIFSLDVIYSDERVDDVKLSLDWNYGLKGSKAYIYIPKLEYEDIDVKASITDAAFGLSYDERLSLNISLDSIAGSYKDYSAEASGLYIKAESDDIHSIRLRELPFSISLKHISAESEDISLMNAGIIFSFKDGSYTLKSNAIKADYSDYSIYIEGLSAATADFKEISSYVKNLKAEENALMLAESESLNMSVDLKSRIGRLKSDRIKIGALSKYLSFFRDSYLDDISLMLSYSDDIDIATSAKAAIYLADEHLDSISFDIDLKSALSDKYSLSDFDISLTEIRSPFFNESGYIKAKGSLESFSLDMKLGTSVISSLTYDEALEGTLSIRNFKLGSLSPLIKDYAKPIAGYIGEETMLNGNIGFELNKDKSAKFGFSGPLSFNFALNSIAFNEYSFNLGASLAGSLIDDKLEVEEGSLTSDFARAYFDGGIDFTNMLPYGSFVLSNTKNGAHYVDLKLDITGERIYTFELSSPYLEKSTMSGSLNLSVRNQIRSFADLKVGNASYPFDIDVNLEEKRVDLDNPEMKLFISWMDTLGVQIELDDFPIFPAVLSASPSQLDGNLRFGFDFVNQQFNLDSPRLEIRNLSLFNGNPDIAFSIKGDNSSVAVDNIRINAAGFAPLSGSFLLDMKDFAILLGLSDGSADGERLLVSIIREKDGYTGVLSGTKINLERYGQEGLIGELNLTGEGKSIEDFVFTGTFSGKSFDEINSPKNFNSSIIVDSSSVHITDISIKTESVDAGIENIYIDSREGKLAIDNINAAVAMEHTDRTYNASASLSLSADFTPSDTLYEAVKNLIRTQGEGVRISGSINSLNYDDTLVSPMRTFEGIYSNKALSLSGDALSGRLDFSSGIYEVDVNAMPLFDVKAVIDRNGEYGTDYYLTINDLAVSVANLSFRSPVIVFYNPSYLRGELDIIRKKDGYKLYGSLDGDEAQFDMFWLPGERIILHNPNFMIWDNVISSNLVSLSAMNEDTNERVPGLVKLEINLGSSLAFEYFEVDVYLDEDDYVNFRLPMSEANIDLIGKVSGHYHIDNITGVFASSGSLRIKDAVLSMGMRELPSWFSPLDAELSNDFDLELVSNNEIMVPLSEQPILTAVASNNTRLKFHNDKNGMVLGGDLNIRSGELYYIQKYFYITDGNIHFEDNAKTLDPVVDLTARLRDFDSDGKQVDIYLSLNDAKLDNINPSFSSSPAKPLNEIMQILGQAILPTASYSSQSSLTRVASLVTASFDVLSRVGLIKSNGTGLDKTIKESLGLDVFSLHSNIVSNIITDTIVLSGLSSASNDLSPMARYMDGTSIYIGKYIRPDIYLQALLHLSAEYNKNESKHTFLSDDLVLDSEFSVEWNNPLCVFTFFTKPVNLTFYSILEGFGFSVSKRLQF